MEESDFAIELVSSSRDIVLTKDVTVHSTVTIPVKYDENSIIIDIMVDPKGRTVVNGMLAAMKQSMGISDEAKNDGTSSAASPDMMAAMMQYMLLRASLLRGRRDDGRAVQRHSEYAELLTT